MNPVETKTTNTVFVAPDCHDLPGTRFKFDDGTPCIEVCFKLSDDEMAQIVVNDGHLFLYMLGETVPPLFLDTKSILVNGGPKDETHR